MQPPRGADESKVMSTGDSGSADKSEAATSSGYATGSGRPRDDGTQPHTEISAHAHTISQAVALAVIDDIPELAGQGATNGRANNLASGSRLPACVHAKADTDSVPSSSAPAALEGDSNATGTNVRLITAAASGGHSDQPDEGSRPNLGAQVTSTDASEPSGAAVNDTGRLPEQVAENQKPTNPGSIGHPELCPRPCLYFPTGQCANGARCNFCHMLHPKRPAHLDKRHRVMLKEMLFSECVTLMMPILRQKVHALQCDAEAIKLLDALEAAAFSGARSPGAPCQGSSGPGAFSGNSGGVSSSSIHALQTALRAMSMRSLLAMLHRAAVAEASVERAAIDCLMQHLRCQDRSVVADGAA